MLPFRTVLPNHTQHFVLTANVMSDLIEPRSARSFEVKIINDAPRSARSVGEGKFCGQNPWPKHGVKTSYKTTLSEKCFFLVNRLVC